jgi:purine-nucleoside phosphorylase
MSVPYDRKLIALCEETGKRLGVKLQKGCYVGTTGPTFETPMEYVYFRRIGGDAVGMSTVPEVIVARHADIPVFAMSIITDLGVEGQVCSISHEEVQREGAKAEKKMTQIMTEMLSSYH